MINAIYFYRLARWLYLHKIPIIPKVIDLCIFLMYKSRIPYKAVIGKNSFFIYGGIGVLINPTVSIGTNCSIGVNAMIVGQGPYKYSPRIGNRVFIGPGAVVQGPVIIEDNVIIAPNSVVNKSVPEGMIVAGIPAKIVGRVSDLNYDIFENEIFDETIKPYLPYE